jgi:hypothetical protein
VRELGTANGERRGDRRGQRGGGDVVDRERPHSGEVKVVCRALSKKKKLPSRSI